jgi:serine protease inhibitor
VRIYPSIAPNFLKELKLPSYNTVISEFPDGGENRIQLSTIGVGTKLTLSYEGLTEIQVASIMNFYANCKGEGYAFLLPSTVMNHPTVINTAIAALKATTYWVFEGQVRITPRYTTYQRGIFDIEVTLSSVVS